jgi:hypothetical protein
MQYLQLYLIVSVWDWVTRWIETDLTCKGRSCPQEGSQQVSEFFRITIFRKIISFYVLPFSKCEIHSTYYVSSVCFVISLSSSYWSVPCSSVPIGWTNAQVLYTHILTVANPTLQATQPLSLGNYTPRVIIFGCKKGGYT